MCFRSSSGRISAVSFSRSDAGYELSHPVLRPKPNAHRLCVHEQYVHTYVQYECLQYAKCHKYTIIIAQINVLHKCKRLSRRQYSGRLHNPHEINQGGASLELLVKEFHLFTSI
jgi:hypothetical protein